MHRIPFLRTIAMLGSVPAPRGETLAALHRRRGSVRFPGRHLLSLATALAVLSTFAPHTSATLLLPAPSARNQHASIYDPVRHRVVIFGGGNGSLSALNDVWALSFDPVPAWVQIFPIGAPPPGRTAAGAIYDPIQDRMIVFGGYVTGVGFVNDVWELSFANPPTWRQLNPAGTPPTGRSGFVAYDSQRHRMLVFGGLDGFIYNSDTWALSLDGAPTWTPISVYGPAGRNGHSVLYDPQRDRLLVLGGYSGFFFLNDGIWALSLASPAWKQLQVSGGVRPTGRTGHTWTYDAPRDRALLFGGNDGSSYRNDCWAVSLNDTSEWTELTAGAEAPIERVDHSSTYDPDHQQMVVVSGFGSNNEFLLDSWALVDLAQTPEWAPLAPSIRPSDLAIHLNPVRVTLGDTATAVIHIRNPGLLPLDVAEVAAPPGMSAALPVPFQVPARGSLDDSLSFAPTVARAATDTVDIVSDDPASPTSKLPVALTAIGLDVDSRVLSTSLPLPLGEPATVIVTPRPDVMVESGTLFFGPADSAVPPDSIPLNHAGSVFVGIIPGSAVTEVGLRYYIRVENGQFAGWDPPSAPQDAHVPDVGSPGELRSVAKPRSVLGFPTGENIDIETTIPAGVSVTSGQVHYREAGQTTFRTDTLLANSSLGTLVGVIPGESVGPTGVEWWVDLDTRSHRLTYPTVQPEQNPAITRTTVRSETEPRLHFGMRYRMLSIPVDFAGDSLVTLETILADQFQGYDPTRWRMFRYIPSSGMNVEWAADQGSTFRPIPGRGFWLITRGPHKVDTAPAIGLSTDAAAPYAIELEPGWNQIGDPFDFPVAWASVVKPAGVDSLVAFDPTLRANGDYADAPPDVLEPFEGYFVHAAIGGTLLVPPVEAPKQPPVNSTASGRAGKGWRVRLRAATANAVDGSNVVGVDPTSAEGRDPADLPKPPGSPDPWVSLGMELPGEAGAPASLYRRDLRGTDGEGHAWELEVRSSAEAERVAIDFTALSALPDSVSLRLIDRELGTASDLRRADGMLAGYQLMSYGPRRAYRLTLLAGSAAYLARTSGAQEEIPNRVVLDPAEPNPSRGLSRIRFGLPTAEAVTLEILDVMGRRVTALLDRTQTSAGYHALLWGGTIRGGGQAPSGIYFCRLAAGRILLTRKLVWME